MNKLPMFVGFENTIDNKERVCLIVPPSIFLLDERVFISIGILKVAAVLEAKGYTVEMVDLSGVQNYEEAIKDHAKFSKCKHFGITSTTPQLPAATKVCEAIRSVRDDAVIIIGGPHPTLVNAAWKRELKDGRFGRAHRAKKELEEIADIIVAGDGEEAIFVAIQDDSPTWVDADDPKSDLFLTNNKLTELPFPARHLVDVVNYNYKIEGIKATSLIAQLGCPFGCGFCGGRLSPFLRRIRMRTTENIVDEIMYLYHSYGFKGFMFYDDELNVNKEMIPLMNAIAVAQNEVGEEFRLRGFLKAELFTDEQAQAMYKAGFRWILTGFESGHPRILKNINKRATREDNTRCVEIAKRNGLKVKALMSIGHPGESYETVMATRDWLLEVKPDDFDVTIITTYPGTPYYDMAVPLEDEEGVWVYTQPKTGDKLYAYEVDYRKVAEYYKGDPDGGYKAYVYTDHLTSDELVDVREKVEREVRATLNIPFNPGAPAVRYEHSMGQFGKLPSSILRTSAAK